MVDQSRSLARLSRSRIHLNLGAFDGYSDADINELVALLSSLTQVRSGELRTVGANAKGETPGIHKPAAHYRLIISRNRPRGALNGSHSGPPPPPPTPTNKLLCWAARWAL